MERHKIHNVHNIEQEVL